MLHLPSPSRLLLALLFGSAVGCSSADAEVTEDADLTSSAPLGPASLVDCWVSPDTSTSDVFYQSHPLTCTSKVPANYPLKPTYVLQYTTAAGKVATLTERDLASGAKVMGKLTSKDFPVALKFKVTFPSQLDANAVQSLEVTRKIETVQSTPSERPASFKSPFSVWYIELKSRNATSVSADYTVDLGDGYKTSVAGRTPSTKLSIRGSFLSSNRPEVALMAPASGSIPVRLGGVAGTVDGPGVYVFDGTKLTKEAARNDVEGGCGTAGQAPCTTSEGRAFCQKFNQLEGASCEACGQAGQQPCSAGLQCSFEYEAPLEVNQDTQTCEACGLAGQIPCLIPESVRAWTHTDEVVACAENFDYDARTSAPTCFPCGGHGQVGCYVTWFTRTTEPSCKEGHVYDAAIKRCRKS